jgi:hypothetical protein
VGLVGVASIARPPDHGSDVVSSDSEGSADGDHSGSDHSDVEAIHPPPPPPTVVSACTCSRCAFYT